MRIHLIFYARIVILSFFCTCAHAQLLTIPTADKSTTLNVLVEYPYGRADITRPVVVFGGGVFADRDYTTNASDVTSDPNSTFLFGQLSQRFREMGFIVVRYDQRGINGNVFTCEKGVRLTYAKYIKQCVDDLIRSSVIPQNIQSDYESVFKFASQLKAADSKRIYALGHSEASIHIAVLIGERRIAPAGVISIAGVAEPPAKIVEWQFIDRFVEAIASADTNKDGVITNEEIRNLFFDKNTIFSQESKNSEVLYVSPTGSWKVSDLKPLRQQVEQLFMKPFIASINTPYAYTTAFKSSVSGVEVTWASYGWMLGLINDTKPAIDRLDAFPGNGLFIFFSLDSKVSAPRQIAAINKSKFGLAQKAKVITINGFGHALGKLPSEGPVDPQAMNDVSAAIRAWLPASIQNR
jgi:hypothetical protein